MTLRTGKHTAGYTTFGRSDKHIFPIAAGEVTRLDVIDLKANYAWIRVCCDDCSGVQASTVLTALVANDAASQLNTLWQQNGSAAWESGNLPTSGGFDFMLAQANGIRRIRFILSNAASQADVILYVYGYDPAAV